MIWITQARYIKNYQLWIQFNDATEKIVDLQKIILSDKRTCFLPLQNPTYFKKFRVNKKSDTVEWPNGVDIAPEILYAL